MRPRHVAAVAVFMIAVAVIGAAPASACGGLVGENGTIRLDRTSTLAGYHDGVEHYITSFSFTGEGKEVGSIIPLPGVPTLVERAGDWTLQRLEREVTPVAEFSGRAADSKTAAAPSAQVLLETKVDALDITILKGGGAEVGTWALDHGFFLTPDAPEVLDSYSRRSPIFMAARFDASAAQATGQQAGDGTPIHLAIPTPQPWVPLRILGLGLPATEAINADVFLLTDSKPHLLAGRTGLTLERSEAASESLMQDLRSDKNSSWIPDQAWLTYLKVNAAAGDLHYDLAASVNSQTPSRVAAGLEIPSAEPIPQTTFKSSSSGDIPWTSLLALTAVLLGGVAVIALIADGRGQRVRGRVSTKRLVGLALAVSLFAATIVAAGLAVAAQSGSGEPVDGAGKVIHLTVHHSRFVPDRVTVSPNTTVRFVIENTDPILHEFIIGDAGIHERHENGTEQRHPPRPGEVTVDPGTTAETTYYFDDTSPVLFACHLPGHFAYGMFGNVVVTS